MDYAKFLEHLAAEMAGKTAEEIADLKVSEIANFWKPIASLGAQVSEKDSALAALAKKLDEAKPRLDAIADYENLEDLNKVLSGALGEDEKKAIADSAKVAALKSASERHEQEMAAARSEVEGAVSVRDAATRAAGIALFKDGLKSAGAKFASDVPTFVDPGLTAMMEEYGFNNSFSDGSFSYGFHTVGEDGSKVPFASSLTGKPMTFEACLDEAKRHPSFEPYFSSPQRSSENRRPANGDRIADISPESVKNMSTASISKLLFSNTAPA